MRLRIGDDMRRVEKFLMSQPAECTLVSIS